MARPVLVDVSRWQGLVDAAALKAAGFVGIVARCTMGVIATDEEYLRTQLLARNEGMIFGGYHLLWPENKSPELEAEWYDENAGVTDLDVLDTELTHGLAKRAVMNQSYDWFQQLEIERPTSRKVQYTGSWWWTLNQGPLEQEYDLFEAEYTVSVPQGGVDKSQAPTGDPAKLGPGWTDWKFWQWTSAGRPIGVQSKSLDYFIFNGSMEELVVYLGLEETPDPPTPAATLRLEALEQWAISQGYIPPVP